MITAPDASEKSESEKSFRFSEKEMLDAHNVIRKSVHVESLSWSDSLSKSAQKWSEVLKSENCAMRHEYDSPFGENIYWTWTTDVEGKGPISHPSEAVNMWAAESKEPHPKGMRHSPHPLGVGSGVLF